MWSSTVACVKTWLLLAHLRGRGCFFGCCCHQYFLSTSSHFAKFSTLMPLPPPPPPGFPISTNLTFADAYLQGIPRFWSIFLERIPTLDGKIIFSWHIWNPWWPLVSPRANFGPLSFAPSGWPKKKSLEKKHNKTWKKRFGGFCKLVSQNKMDLSKKSFCCVTLLNGGSRYLKIFLSFRF